MTHLFIKVTVMTYIHVDADNNAKMISTKEAMELNWEGVISNRELDNPERTAQLTEMLNKTAGSQKYMIIDHGEHVGPRYDVIEKPQVGDPVSYAFNGDYYPCGHISAISASMKIITTTTGKKFYRRKQTAKWLESNTWALVSGHISKLNPSF